MRAPRILVAATVLLGAAGCSGPGEQPGAGSPSSPAPPTTPGPTLAGSAEAAALTGRPAGPAAGTAVLDDVGLSATPDLATGRYDVSGRHLSLAAPLAADGQEIGPLALEVDCG